ncbi:MAG: FAD-binding protein, partial [Cyclobacteriaceae bacterium]
MMSEILANWGNYPKSEAKLLSFNSFKSASELIENWDHFIPRGNGRCYGDSALADKIVSTLKYDKFISFDQL